MLNNLEMFRWNANEKIDDCGSGSAFWLIFFSISFHLNFLKLNSTSNFVLSHFAISHFKYNSIKFHFSKKYSSLQIIELPTDQEWRDLKSEMILRNRMRRHLYWVDLFNDDNNKKCFMIYISKWFAWHQPSSPHHA